jgi:hypothetical protein
VQPFSEACLLFLGKLSRFLRSHDDLPFRHSEVGTAFGIGAIGALCRFVGFDAELLHSAAKDGRGRPEQGMVFGFVVDDGGFAFDENSGHSSESRAPGEEHRLIIMAVLAIPIPIRPVIAIALHAGVPVRHRIRAAIPISIIAVLIGISGPVAGIVAVMMAAPVMVGMMVLVSIGEPDRSG